VASAAAGGQACRSVGGNHSSKRNTQVAVVFLSDDFFDRDRNFCRDELRLVIKYASNCPFPLVPVFWTLTVDEVERRVAALFSSEKMPRPSPTRCAAHTRLLVHC
jgi:hypothetical protein